jgi:hypothetical protein
MSLTMLVLESNPLSRILARSRPPPLFLVSQLKNTTSFDVSYSRKTGEQDKTTNQTIKQSIQTNRQRQNVRAYENGHDRINKHMPLVSRAGPVYGKKNNLVPIPEFQCSALLPKKPNQGHFHRF